MNFLKNLFKGNQYPSLNEHEYYLFFNLEKTSYIILSIHPEQNIQDVYNFNHNSIIDYILSTNTSKAINSSEFKFLIMNQNNPNIRIKLKETDIPKKYLSKKGNSLFYLNCTKLKEEDKEKANKVINKTFNKEGKEIIREGELFKYSYKHNKFDKRYLILDKEKLILRKLKENEIHVIFFSEIQLLTTDITDKKIKQEAIGKFIFELRTKDSERFYFSSKSQTDLESWIDTIRIILKMSKDNQKISDLCVFNTMLCSEIYASEVKLMSYLFTINGIFSVKPFKRLFAKYDSLFENNEKPQNSFHKGSDDRERKYSKYEALINNSKISSNKEHEEQVDKSKKLTSKKSKSFNEPITSYDLTKVRRSNTSILSKSNYDFLLLLSPTFNERKSINFEKSNIDFIIQTIQDFKECVNKIKFIKIEKNYSMYMSVINEAIYLFNEIFNQAEYTKIHKSYEEYCHKKNLPLTTSFSSNSVIDDSNLNMLRSKQSAASNDSNFIIESKRNPIKLSNHHFKKISNIFSLIENCKEQNKHYKLHSVLKADIFDEFYHKALLKYYEQSHELFVKDIIEMFNKDNQFIIQSQKQKSPLQALRKELYISISNILACQYVKGLLDKWYLGLDRLYRFDTNQ